MSTEQEQSQRLQAIVETIVQVARPERVILTGRAHFTSTARRYGKGRCSMTVEEFEGP